VGTPKAGVFAEGRAAVVADRISALIRGADQSANYNDQGMCHLEFGHDQVARVDVTFLSGAKPTGGLDGPSQALAADKIEFGSSRIRGWFGRTWPGAD
jgi:sulfide:quinone oxidoreductase